MKSVSPIMHVVESFRKAFLKTSSQFCAIRHSRPDAALDHAGALDQRPVKGCDPLDSNCRLADNFENLPENPIGLPAPRTRLLITALAWCLSLRTREAVCLETPARIASRVAWTCTPEQHHGLALMSAQETTSA
jgi:hypothetical protein